tara:strand:+ start:2203 stop:2448 length:246 start_codon:yes stop_codon:yes gene_type:complete
MIDTKKSAREIILKAYNDLIELRDNPLRSDGEHMDRESMDNNIFLNTTINYLSDKNKEIRTRIWKEEAEENKKNKRVSQSL